MRLVEFDSGWVLLKPLTVRGVAMVKDSSALTVFYHIAAWSEGEVTFDKFLQLKAEVFDRLRKELFETAEPIWSMDKELLRRYVHMYLHNIRTDDKIYQMLNEKYFWTLPSMFDHRGNIIHLPEKGGILDQPVDWFIVLTIYRAELIRELQQQQKGG